MLNTSKLKKKKNLCGFRLKTSPSIVLKLWAALLTMQAHHPVWKGSDSRLALEGTNDIPHDSHLRVSQKKERKFSVEISIGI